MNSLSLTAKILSLLFLMTLWTDSFSCTCGGSHSIQEEFDNKESIVSGEIVSREILRYDSMEKRKLEEKGYLSFPQAKYSLKLSRIYKGKFAHDTIDVYTSPSGASCGYEFEIGNKYLVYGFSDPDWPEDYPVEIPPASVSIWTGICTRTKAYEKKEARKLKNLSKRYSR
jgi:hypothetical protein